MSEHNDVQGPQAQHQPVLLRQMRQWVQDEIAEWERYATKAREAQALLPTAPGADVATNTIRVCRGWLAALDELDRQPIDLVLMDVQMPVMDGYTATQRIREREAQLGLTRTPIVALTANAFDEDAAYALAVGMDAHLAKPYSHAQLRGMLAIWL